MTKDELLFFVIGLIILFIFAGPSIWWINLLLIIGLFLAPIWLPLYHFLFVVY